MEVAAQNQEPLLRVRRAQVLLQEGRRDRRLLPVQGGFAGSDLEKGNTT